MKKIVCPAKRLLAGMLILAVLIGMLPEVHAQAAKKLPAIKSVAIKNGSKNVTKKTISVVEGKKVSLKVVVKPLKAKKSIAFKSSRSSVAKVNSKGTVTAKKAGTSKITVTVRGKNGKKKTAYVNVKVKAETKTIDVTSVTARISQSQLTVGDTAQITAIVSPANATNKNLTYTSSNENVAFVNQEGKVTAKAAGTAKITVKSSNGKSASVDLSVKDRIIDVDRVEVGILPAATVVKGNTARITATVFPADATDKTLKYTSSDETVASVDAAGKVTANETGTTTIKVETSNGKYAEVTITVCDKYSVQVKEVRIEDGDDSIYGKLYAPKQEGTWPIVILSHGYNGNNGQFEIDCQLFAENGYMAYAYDFCGGSNVSKSSGNTTDMTIFTEKQNLLSVFEYIKDMENVDTEQIFLLGGSQGGLVTTLAAEELSDQVKGMILYFPALCIADDWRRNFKTVDEIPDVYNFWDMDLGRNFFMSIREFDPYDVIGNYPNHVLIIWGDQDTVVPRTYVERAQQAYQNAEDLIVVPNVGHNSSSAIFRESALSFMREQ